MIRSKGEPSSLVRRVLAIVSPTACVSVVFAMAMGLHVIAAPMNERPLVSRGPGIPGPQSSAGCLLLNLTISNSGDDSLLSWDEKPVAQRYCVERGDLATLRATGGDFTGSLRQELASNTTATSLVFSGSPAEGEGYWFLVKDSPGGTFDSGCPSQIGSRDFEILSAGDFCVN